MTTIAPEEEHMAEEPDFKPLTAEEAAEWRKRNPPVSVVRVVKWQLIVGVVLALLVALVTQRAVWAWSAAYGAAAVVMGFKSPSGRACRAALSWRTGRVARCTTMSTVSAITAISSACRASVCHKICRASACRTSSVSAT